MIDKLNLEVPTQDLGLDMPTLHGILPQGLLEGKMVPKILFVTSFPPRECGIATYTKDLINSLNNHFEQSFKLEVCAVESDLEQHDYDYPVHYKLNADRGDSYTRLMHQINTRPDIGLVMIQHEFGFFRKCEKDFLKFLNGFTKPVIVAFHTVLPKPDPRMREHVVQIVQTATAVTVMTHSSSSILVRDYDVIPDKIHIIPHGTHLVKHTHREILKEKYELTGKKIFSTFGLLGPGKNIETTLRALPGIIEKHPDILFLIIGKTHPTLKKAEGEKYRDFLKQLVDELKLDRHVKFIDRFVALPTLLEYLQLSDIYLFTSKDPNQAVSGTFSYAMSCGLPIISTPIPHALEVLRDDTGIVIDFEAPDQLANAVLRLLDDVKLRKAMGHNGLLYSASTAWENAAIAHARLFKKTSQRPLKLKFKKPELSLEHIKKMTTRFGILQFSVINHPDPTSGYTLDDNARALVAFCGHYSATEDLDDLKYIKIYLDFIFYCYQGKNGFYNYVDFNRKFTSQNGDVNLEDANGRAIWALGFFLSISPQLPPDFQVMVRSASDLLQMALCDMHSIHSTRAMAFIIKGLYYQDKVETILDSTLLIKKLADRMVQMYRHESSREWQWFEGYFTYANSVMPEALLLAYKVTGCQIYRKIAQKSFNYLLSHIFVTDHLKLIPNKSWLQRSDLLDQPEGGEQPIDVAYTILALKEFDKEFPNAGYDDKMRKAFNWFMGENHLHQILYNPCTGGCYDGLEKNYVNLNQGAESTVSYILARLAFIKTDVKSNAPTKKKENLKSQILSELQN